MSWALAIYAFVMTLVAGHYGTKAQRHQQEAAILRIACERAEDALVEIAEMGGTVELPDQTVYTGEGLAARLGVDIKSRLS